MPVDPFPFLVLVAASCRLTRLVVFDSLFGSHPDSGSSWSRTLDKWAWKVDGADRTWARGKVGTLLVCPYCAGAWISLALVCVWLRWWPWWLGVEGWIVVAAVAGGQALANALDRKLAD